MGGGDDFLEDYYDVVVLSTGLKTSILAAALAKSGRSVLHLDRNEYYGEDSASFSFTQLLDWTSDHAHDNTNTNLAACNNANRAAAKSPAGSSNGACPSYDPETVGLAIARGHARNELKKEREAAEKASSSSSSGNGGHDAKKPPTAQETNSNGVNTGSSEVAQSHDTSVIPPPSAADTDKKTTTESGQDPSSPETTETTTAPPARAAGEQEEKEEEEKSRKEEEQQKKNDDDLLVEKAAASRLKSLDLHLLPLDYHGCCTKAGTPSDTCVKERAEQKAAEEAAAAAGRFRRRLSPSHPAWIGRTASKEKKAEGRGGGGMEGGGQEAFTHPSFWGFKTDRAPGAADLVRLSRSFNLDLTSQVLLANGPAVDALVASGVSNYLEFKDMQALYLGADLSDMGKQRNRGGAASSSSSRWRDHASSGLVIVRQEQTATGGDKNKNATTGNATAASQEAAQSRGSGEGENGKLGLSRVPCSKADIFSTKLLAPLEKRRLMKFLLFVSDWGLQRAGEHVLSRNEAGLGRGRSLRRPQNREAASSDFDYDAYADKPFREFLESCGLPERVRAMITHALALMPGNHDGVGGEVEGREKAAAADVVGGPTTEAGLEAVYRHLSALGRFGETAFIAPLYGVGELPQAFCRMAAVHGAVYVLRRQLKSAVIDRTSGSCVGVVDDAGRTFACGSLVVGGEYFSATSIPTTVAAPTTTAPNANPALPAGDATSTDHSTASSDRSVPSDGKEARVESPEAKGQPPVLPTEQSALEGRQPKTTKAPVALTRQQQDMARHAQQHIDHQMRVNNAVLSTDGTSSATDRPVVPTDPPSSAPDDVETLAESPDVTLQQPAVVVERQQEARAAPTALTSRQQDMARHAQQQIDHQMHVKEQAQKNLEYTRQQRQNWLDKQQQQQQQKQQPRQLRRLSRRIVLASGPVIAPTAANTSPAVPRTAAGATGATVESGEGRGLCVLPPGLQSVGNNTAAIHAVSLDASTAACPDTFGTGMCVLHLSTITPAGAGARCGTDAEDRGFSAEQSKGAEGGGGNGGGQRGGKDDGNAGVLGRAAKALLDAATVNEIWSVGFSWDIQNPVAEKDLPPNMLVCERPSQEFYLHEVVMEAERAFSRLCPGEPFWPPPAADQDEDDDQAEMLKAVASTVQDSDGGEKDTAGGTADKGEGGDKGETTSAREQEKVGNTQEDVAGL